MGNQKPEGVLRERLREIQTQMGVANDYEFAKKCGISPQYLSDIYSAKRKGIRKIFDIAFNLKTSVGFLLGQEIMIPIVAEVSAGEPFYFSGDEQPIDLIDVSDIPGFDARRVRDFYALRVRGDSMYPVMKDRDMLIVEKESFYKVKGGDKVVFQDAEGRSWVKYVEFHDDLVIVRPMNPAYPTITINKKDVEVMDKVKVIVAI